MIGRICPKQIIVKFHIFGCWRIKSNFHISYTNIIRSWSSYYILRHSNLSNICYFVIVDIIYTIFISPLNNLYFTK
ncbi:unnamed protein product [Blepharisma stoltei]|uniref:Uncharacterized protein n=1 Tax=Blepharisma stoltei TaxID=1481888 RepID=A0AAU9K4V8_9CILI|nr:unnamed protein product [Blepharisma stoltei]